jgi:hypothetical protein
MKKNVASQRWVVRAFDATDGSAVTGDAANITAKISKDGAALTATNDTNPTELEDGLYEFDLTQAETNAYELLLSPESSTADVEVVGEPANVIYTTQFDSTSGYPQSDMAAISSSTTAADDLESAMGNSSVSGYIASDVIYWSGVGVTYSSSNSLPEVDAKSISDSTTASDNMELDYDGTGYTKTNSTVGTVTDVTNQVTADITAISGDSTAADNLELQYDGTGITGDTFPARQDQLGNLSGGSSGWSINAAGVTITQGIETNSYTDTFSSGVIHIIEDNGGLTDFYYEFDLSEYTGVGTQFLWNGYVQTNGDSVDVEYYDWDTTSYVTLETLSGSPGTTVASFSFDVPVNATGTGANLGLVRMRFNSATTTAIGTDRVRCVFNQSVSGITNGSTVTLNDDTTNKNLIGNNWNLIQNGQIVEGAYIKGAVVSGTGTGTTGTTYEDCFFSTATIPPSACVRCGISLNSTTLSLGSAGDYRFIGDPTSAVPGSPAATIDCTAGGANITLELRGYSGGVTLNGLKAGDVCTVGGPDMGTITLNGADAEVEVRGIWKDVVNNLTGSPSVTKSGVEGTDIADILVDTNSLNDTKIPHTLNTTVSGNIGINWASVENPLTSVILTNTTVGTTNYIGDKTGFSLAPNQTSVTIGVVQDATVTAGTATFFQDFFTVDSTQVSGDEVSGSVMLEMAKINWDRVITAANHNIASSAGRTLRTLGDPIVYDGDVVSATVNTITLDSSASSNAGAYEPASVYITSGTGSGQIGTIVEYFPTAGNGNAAKTLILAEDLDIVPDGTSKVIIYLTDGRIDTNQGQVRASTSTTVQLNDQAPTDVDISGQMFHATGSTGQDQSRLVLSYDQPTRTITVSPLDVTLDATTSYKIYPFGQSTIEAIQCDAQSAADLKDFVDEGYDPTTNKVQGVVTVDTVTDKSGYSISGTLTTLDALNTQLNTDHGSGSWESSGGITVAEIWSYVSRTLTGTINDFDELDAALTLSHGSGSWTTGGGDTIYVQPVQSTIKIDGGVTKNVLYADQNLKWGPWSIGVEDSNGDELDVTGRNMTMVFYTDNSPSDILEQTTPTGDGSTITVAQFTPDDPDRFGTYLWKIYDVNAQTLLSAGRLDITQGPPIS